LRNRRENIARGVYIKLIKNLEYFLFHITSRFIVHLKIMHLAYV